MTVAPNFHKPLWDKFNPSQLRAVKKVDGAAQICAVAGSGKTTVVVHRTEHMINDHKIDPKKIALMTFTAKAAKEMEERLVKLMGKQKMYGMFCGTSHSFGFKVLAKEYEVLNHHLKTFTRKDVKDPGVLTGTYLSSFVVEVKEKMLKSLPWDQEMAEDIEKTSEKEFLFAVSRAKNANLNPEQYAREMSLNPKNLKLIEFYRLYESMKYAKRCIDFDDMLFLTVKLFRDHPAILRKYQGVYEYVMIDETQDNNPTQYELAKMIAYPQNNLFVVGDDDQALYTWRGAAPDLFIRFKEMYNAEMIPLEHNYRSAPGILNVANKLIVNNKNRIKKQLVAHREDDGKSVSYNRFSNEASEADFVVDEIVNICNDPDRDFTNEINYKDIFVVYRTNAQSVEVESALITKGLPYVIHGGISFYERKEVKDLVAYLTLAVDKHDDSAFKRVINTPTRFLGKAFLDKISGYGSYWNGTEIVQLAARETENVGMFRNLVLKLESMNNDPNLSMEDMIDHIMDSGYRDHLSKGNAAKTDDEDEDENSIVTKLKHLLSRFESIEKFIEYIELMLGQKKESLNGVQLMTINRSKGLEAPYVFGVGMNEGTLPHAKSVEAFETGENTQAIEEERRLAYVLVTRPKDKLYLSSSASFNGFACKQSRYIDEMELQDEKKTNAGDEKKEAMYIGVEMKNIADDASEIDEILQIPLIKKPEIRLNDDFEIVDLIHWNENNNNNQAPQPQPQEEITEKNEDEEETEEKAPDGYEYFQHEFFGKMLKPVKKGSVTSKYL